jgi:hypothetical protein
MINGGKYCAAAGRDAAPASAKPAANRMALDFMDAFFVRHWLAARRGLSRREPAQEIPS